MNCLKKNDLLAESVTEISASECGLSG